MEGKVPLLPMRLAATLAKRARAFALHNVAIKDGHVYGTDGHIAVAVRFERPPEPDSPIPLKKENTGIRLIPHSALPLLPRTEREASVTPSSIKAGAVTVEFPVVSDTYPNVEGAVPSGPCSEAYFNPKLLGEALVMISKLIGPLGLVRLRVFGPEKAVIIDDKPYHGHGGEVRVLVMPCKADGRMEGA